MNQDPIADMLSRIRNAIAARHASISLPHSNAKEQVAKVLQKSGYLNDVSATGKGKGKVLNIAIYPEGQNATINHIQRLSKPGQRRYVNSSHIPKVKSGRGMVVISTSKGIMSGEQAKKAGVGGELICEVY